jgi:hypothetical protein
MPHYMTFFGLAAALFVARSAAMRSNDEQTTMPRPPRKRRSVRRTRAKPKESAAARHARLAREEEKAWQRMRELVRRPAGFAELRPPRQARLCARRLQVACSNDVAAAQIATRGSLTAESILHLGAMRDKLSRISELERSGAERLEREAARLLQEAAEIEHNKSHLE